MVSATAADDAPLFACILHTGLKRPAGNASLNSLCRVSNGCGRNYENYRRNEPWDGMVGMIVRFECQEQPLSILLPLLFCRNNANWRSGTIPNE